MGGDWPPGYSDGRFWVGAFGRNEEADLEYGISGYTYKPRGAMLGYDKTIGGFSVGGALAYGHGKYEDKASTSNDSKISSYSGGLYGSYHGQSGFKASAHLTYSHLRNDLRDLRGGMWRDADYSSYSWSVGGKLGYDLFVNEQLTLSPSIGLNKIQAISRSHDEALNGFGVLRVGEVRRDALLVPLDVTLGYGLFRSSDTLPRLTGNCGYPYDLADGGLGGSLAYEGLAGASSMGVADRDGGKNRYNLGVGVVFTNNRFDVGARYDYTTSSGQTSHQAQGNLGIKF